MKGKAFLATVVVPLAIFFGGSAITVAVTSHIPHNSPTVSNSVSDSQGIGTRTLSPCPTEDSDNCYWDARTMGNGPERISKSLNPGTSFVTIDGTTITNSGRYIIVLPECVDSDTVPCANRDEGNEWRIIFEYAPNGSPLRYAPIERY